MYKLLGLLVIVFVLIAIPSFSKEKHNTIYNPIQPTPKQLTPTPTISNSQNLNPTQTPVIQNSIKNVGGEDRGEREHNDIEFDN